MTKITPQDINVLIAEDRVEMRKIVKSILAYMGIRSVFEVGDGEEALKHLCHSNKRDPDNPYAFDRKPPNTIIKLVICDWNMPKLSGLELLQEIRKDIELQTLPFIMITSESDKEHVVQASAAGVTDYIVKPFQAKTLELKIKSLFGI